MGFFTMEYLTTLLVLAMVIGLMLVAAYGIRRTGIAGPVLPTGGEKRLRVVEIMPIDARRRLVLVRRDDVEHLLLLGADGERVVETNIDASERPLPAQTNQKFADTMALLSRGRLNQRPGSGADASVETSTDPKKTEPNDRP